MGLFKIKVVEERGGGIPTLPELPRLPELPEMREVEIRNLDRSSLQLPSFPTNSLGEKFSQNTIKDAITGKKEDEEVLDADEFSQMEKEMRMMQKPLKKQFAKEMPYPKKGGRPLSRKILEYGGEIRAKKIEPVFIRIDKFEESLQIFDKTKKQITEIEKMLKEIQKIKGEEERELEYWENEISSIKEQIDKVDKDIFSKIE